LAFNEPTPITPKRDDLLPTALDIARIEVEEALQRDAQESASRAPAHANPLQNDDISLIANGFTAQNLRFSALYAARDNGYTADDETSDEGRKKSGDLDIAIDQAIARNNQMIAYLTERLRRIQREISDCDLRLTETSEHVASLLAEGDTLEANIVVTSEEGEELIQTGAEAKQVTAEAESDNTRYNRGERTWAWNKHGDKVAEGYEKAGVGEEFDLLDRDRRGEAVDPQALQEAREKIEQAGLTSNLRTAMQDWLDQNRRGARNWQQHIEARIESNQTSLTSMNRRLTEIREEIDTLKGEMQATIERRELLKAEETRVTEDIRKRNEYNQVLTDPGYRQRVQEKRQEVGSWRDAVTCIEDEYLGTCSAPSSFTTRTSAAGTGITTGVAVQSDFALAASGTAATEPDAPLTPTQERRPALAAPVPG